MKPELRRSGRTLVSCVNEGALGAEALGNVTGDGVAVVEMTTLAGVEFGSAVVVESCREPTFRVRLPVVPIIY